NAGRCEAIIDPDIAAVRPSEPFEFVPESRETFSGVWIVLLKVHQHTDPSHPLALLRARRERPRDCRAAEKRDELAPFRSITSSARASNVAGTVRPNAFAVLRLITNSYLVGACTGRSAGFSPRRIRSTDPAARRYWQMKSP